MFVQKLSWYSSFGMRLVQFSILHHSFKNHFHCAAHTGVQYYVYHVVCFMGLGLIA
jgi:hypothetical protein